MRASSRASPRELILSGRVLLAFPPARDGGEELGVSAGLTGVDFEPAPAAMR